MAKYATSQLDSINEILSVLGQAPVNSLELKTPDVAMAIQVLDRVDRDTQAEGWYFNTELEIDVSPDADSKFPFQENWISADPDATRYQDKEIVPRNGFFYDLRKNTYLLGLSKLTVNAIIYLDWDDLPEAARRYSTLRTARMMAERVLGSADKSGFTLRDEFRARSLLKMEDKRLADSSLMDSNDYMSIIRGRGRSGAIGHGPSGTPEALFP